MKARVLSILVLALLIGVGGDAAPKASLQYLPVACLKGGEMPLFQLAVTGKGGTVHTQPNEKFDGRLARSKSGAPCAAT